MASITEFFNVFTLGAYECLDSDILAVYLEDALLCVDQTCFGDFFNVAVARLMAHNLQLDGYGPNGPRAGTTSIISERAGAIARSYASPTATEDDWFSLTIHGKAFLTIRQKALCSLPFTTAWGYLKGRRP